MLIHTTTFNDISVGFYVNDTKDRSTQISIRVDVQGLQVDCDSIPCKQCPLSTYKHSRFSTSCGERGIEYFEEVTNSSYPEWSI